MSLRLSHQRQRGDHTPRSTCSRIWHIQHPASRTLTVHRRTLLPDQVWSLSDDFSTTLQRQSALKRHSSSLWQLQCVRPCALVCSSVRSYVGDGEVEDLWQEGGVVQHHIRFTAQRGRTRTNEWHDRNDLCELYYDRYQSIRVSYYIAVL